MNRRLLRAATLLAILSTVGACATAPTRPPVTQEQQRAYDRAISLHGDALSEFSAFEEFVSAWPQSPLASDAAMRLGMLSFEQGDRDAALRWFYFVVRNHADGEHAEEARVRAATLEYARGEHEAARELLNRVRFSQLNRAQRRAAFRVLVSTAPDGVAALRWLASLRAEEIEENRVDLVDAEIDRILLVLEGDDFERAVDQIGRRVPSARILLVAAERSLDAGDLSLARDRVDAASRMPLAARYAGLLATVSERLRLREEGPEEIEVLPSLTEVLAERGRDLPSVENAAGTIGVVLPLTGPYASYGLESLRGVLLAAEIFEASQDTHLFLADPAELPAEEPATPEMFDLPAVEAEPPGYWGTVPSEERGGIRLLIRDSAGSADVAARAVRELAQNKAVAAIVGPLVKGACEGAALEAEASGIPLLTLSSRESIAAERPYVFRLRTRNKEEVELLVDHAVLEYGAQTFAILYPDDAYGVKLRSLFWDAVDDRGGVVVGAESYDADAVDFAEPIRRLVGYVLLDDAEQEMLQERDEMLKLARRLPAADALHLREEARDLAGPLGDPLPPIIDFDALFIPDSHEKIVLIAPQLAFHEAVGMRLLGTSYWYHPDLLSIGRNHVRNALVVSLFFEESTASVVQDFVRRFKATFHEQPDSFSAQAYDAANLVLVQLAKGLTTRAGVRDGVLSTSLYPGVSGVLSMARDGNARRRPFLLEVNHGRFDEFE